MYRNALKRPNGGSGAFGLEQVTTNPSFSTHAFALGSSVAGQSMERRSTISQSTSICVPFGGASSIWRKINWDSLIRNRRFVCKHQAKPVGRKGDSAQRAKLI